MRAEIKAGTARALALAVLANSSRTFEIFIDVIAEEVIIASGDTWFASAATTTDATGGCVRFWLPQEIVDAMTRASETVVVTDDKVIFDTVSWTRSE